VSVFRIIAFDPGGKTGWGTFTADRILWPEGEPTYGGPKFKSGTITGLNHHQDLYQLLVDSLEETTLVVCESFEFRNVDRMGTELISVEYIGVIRFFCQEFGLMLHLQTASQGKATSGNAFVKKENLVRLGLWKPNSKDEMDAYGHLLYHMIHTSHVLRNELLEKGWK
jgi:hypothetical protein